MAVIPLGPFIDTSECNERGRLHALIGDGRLEKTRRKVDDAEELRSEVSNTL